MPPALLEHPSRHFYDSLVRCADDAPAPRPPPSGFPWRSGLPLCFVPCGGGDHDLEVSPPWGGKSNPDEAQLGARIVSDILEAGDVRRFNVAVIALAATVGLPLWLSVLSDSGGLLVVLANSLWPLTWRVGAPAPRPRRGSLSL